MIHPRILLMRLVYRDVAPDLLCLIARSRCVKNAFFT